MMEDLTDHGTNDPDDIMVRALPNLEREVESTRNALEQAKTRFASASPFLAQIQQAYDAAEVSLQLQKEGIISYRREHPRETQ